MEEGPEADLAAALQSGAAVFEDFHAPTTLPDVDTLAAWLEYFDAAPPVSHRGLQLVEVRLPVRSPYRSPPPRGSPGKHPMCCHRGRVPPRPHNLAVLFSG
jgi:hypothetical protein